MNFLIFRDFLNFSKLILRFLMIKKIKRKEKMGFIFARDSRGCDVARKATWQRHAGPRGAYAARCVTKRFCASLKHRNIGQTKFIKPKSQR